MWHLTVLFLGGVRGGVGGWVGAVEVCMHLSVEEKEEDQET